MTNTRAVGNGRRTADAVPAILALEDGTVFRGRSFGAPGTSFGEAVFNTAMTGYQEVLTDPSYRRQVVTMTAPQVGNYGTCEADAESDRIQVAAFVVTEAARRVSSHRATSTLRDDLADAGVVGIEGVDTRAVTLHLRDHGAMRSGVSTEITDADELVARVRESPTMEGSDLTGEVTTAEAYDVAAAGDGGTRFRVVALDYGVKRRMLGLLAAMGCHVRVLPASATADDVLAHDPDGVLVSNGPGDPAAVMQGRATVGDLLGRVPLFGICLGSQLLGRALGADTTKLVFGHHGVNQPVLRRRDGVVEISSHNHGFAVLADTLGDQVDEHVHETADHGRVTVSHVNLNDGCVEGLVCHDVPAFAVQYHPEASPGPHDARYLFDDFAALMQRGS